DPREPLLGEPDQLLLAADLAMVAGESARPLRRREPVFDDPAEHPRLEALGPASPQRRHRVSTISRRATDARAIAPRTAAACTAPRPSCTRTIAAPRSSAHTTVASVASSRAAGSS